jgi:LPXTG-motif cell wall-anchored protein
MSTSRVVTVVCAGLLAAMVPQAKADAWNQKTTFTFSGPVEIPGKVLSPGTYVFKLADSQSDRNIVQVFNQNENHLFGTYLAIPDYRLQPTGKPVITFQERAAGAPPAVRAWFYPGDNYGHEFVYQKVKTPELAQVTTTAAPPPPANIAQAPENTPSPEVTAPNNPPPPAENPEVAQASPPPPQTEAPAPQPQAPQTLPQTASQFSLLILIGLLSLASGSFLWRTGGQHSTNR